MCVGSNSSRLRFWFVVHTETSTSYFLLTTYYLSAFVIVPQITTVQHFNISNVEALLKTRNLCYFVIQGSDGSR